MNTQEHRVNDRSASYPSAYLPVSHQQDVLQEMYESPELLNEGLASFEYPLYVADEEEVEYFLGGLMKSIGHAVGGAARAVGKAASAIDKVVPVSTVLASSPLGMAVRAGVGAVQAVAEGRNVFQGAMRSLASDPAMRFVVDTGMAAARGENILKAAQKAAQAGIGDLRKSLQFAAMVAPFVPGIGTGVGAALSAANALAAGQPISEAVIAAARGAVPGGAVAQFAFDTVMDVAKGKKLTESLLESARARIPGGPAAQAAFDAAVTIAKGKSIQDAALAAAGRLLPPSPYAADALSFVKKVASGENIQRAALSQAGNFIMNKIQQQTGPVLSGVRDRIPGIPGSTVAQSALDRAKNPGGQRAIGASRPNAPWLSRPNGFSRQVASRTVPRPTRTMNSGMNNGRPPQSGPIRPGVPAAVSRLRQSFPRQPFVPGIGAARVPALQPRYSEPAAIEPGGQSGRWLQQDGYVLLLEAYD